MSLLATIWIGHLSVPGTVLGAGEKVSVFMKLTLNGRWKR